MAHFINIKLCSLKKQISQLEVHNHHNKRRESRTRQAVDKPYLSIILLPMWKSSLFGIYHPLKNYQASATKRSLKHPTKRDKSARETTLTLTFSKKQEEHFYLFAYANKLQCNLFK